MFLGFLVFQFFSKMIGFSEKVYQAVRQIPKGKVATYGQVAVAAGRPLAARAVGSALHQNPYPEVPCHRVVNAQGRLAPNFGKGGYLEQKRRLLAEGVRFKSEKRVDLKRGLTTLF
jgi:methylated-DNA-protein-cysteine methyltransferase-like protein